MKKMIKWALALCACGALLTGCNDNENGGEGALPASQTLSAFQKQFPDATGVVWSKKNGYDVATFGLATRAAAAARNSAWYPEGGTDCAYTLFEITWEQLLEEAPAVAQAWNESPYKAQGYLLDDEIDRKSYAEADPTYKLEIELQSTERELVYKKDGTLLSDREDLDTEDEADEDDPCPEQILQFISESLPDALIVESDTEHEGGTVTYEVEIVYNRAEADLIFNDKYELIWAAQEVEEEDYADTDVLPAAVYAKFRELAGENEMDEVMKVYLTLTDFKAGSNPRYLLIVEDEQTEDEIVYMTDADGNLIE